MLKVVVFDGGWGGELVADFLQNELNILDIVRVIDWKNAPYDGKTEAEIYGLVERALLPYIGRCDAIVLGGYLVSQVGERLRRRFPRQKFVIMDINPNRIRRLRNQRRVVAVLAGASLKTPEWVSRLEMIFPKAKVVWVDCENWEELINENKMTREYLYNCLKRQFRVVSKMKPERTKHKLPEEVPLGVRMLLDGERKSCNREEAKIAAMVKNLDKLSSAVKVDERKLAEDIKSTDRDGLIAPDMVLVLNTHFLEYQKELEEIFGWNTLVIEFKEKMLRAVCATLGLQGVDGKRPK